MIENINYFLLYLLDIERTVARIVCKSLLSKKGIVWVISLTVVLDTSLGLSTPVKRNSTETLRA